MHVKRRCPRCAHEWSEGVTPNSSDVPGMMSTTAIAKKFDLKPRTVRRWIETGRLPAVRRGTSRQARWMVRVEDVLRLIEESSSRASQHVSGDVIDV